MRRAFTIIELIVVVGIIGVLLTIVVTASKGAIEANRGNRRTALVAIVQQGLLAYQAQHRDLPVEPSTPRTKLDKENNTYTYTGDEVRDLVKALVKSSQQGNPLIDISALYVSRSKGEPGSSGRGTDFMTAIRGTKQNPKKMKLAEMYFGYPENNGTFRRFTIVYAYQTDTLTVSEYDEDKEATN